MKNPSIITFSSATRSMLHSVSKILGKANSTHERRLFDVRVASEPLTSHGTLQVEPSYLESYDALMKRLMEMLHGMQKEALFRPISPQAVDHMQLSTRSTIQSDSQTPNMNLCEKAGYRTPILHTQRIAFGHFIHGTSLQLTCESEEQIDVRLPRILEADGAKTYEDNPKIQGLTVYPTLMRDLLWDLETPGSETVYPVVDSIKGSAGTQRSLRNFPPVLMETKYHMNTADTRDLSHDDGFHLRTIPERTLENTTEPNSATPVRSKSVDLKSVRLKALLDSSNGLSNNQELSEICEFARYFKVRRLTMGLTQTQVGSALNAKEGPAYSQSAICRFEKLDVTAKSAKRMKPVLERWLADAEMDVSNCGELDRASCDFRLQNEATRKRKRRTCFSPQALSCLMDQLRRNPYPTKSEMAELSSKLTYDREVIRVWFCNRRQALKSEASSISSGKSNHGFAVPKADNAKNYIHF